MRKALIMIVALIVCIVPFAYVNAASEERFFNYTATVESESNIEITNVSALDFGNVIPSLVYTDTDSLNIVNTGNREPTTGLNASFTTDIGGVYGLNSTTDVINASYFSLNSFALDTTGAPVEIVANTSIPAGADFNISAELEVPDGQAPGFYLGTVRINWES